MACLLTLAIAGRYTISIHGAFGLCLYIQPFIVNFFPGLSEGLPDAVSAASLWIPVSCQHPFRMRRERKGWEVKHALNG